MTKKIYLTGSSDGRPRREIIIDEFSYFVGTSSGESVVTLPGGRSYTTGSDYMAVFSNGLKIVSPYDYTRSSSTTITAVDGSRFPGGEFPASGRLDFELFKTN